MLHSSTLLHSPSSSSATPRPSSLWPSSLDPDLSRVPDTIYDIDSTSSSSSSSSGVNLNHHLTSREVQEVGWTDSTLVPSNSPVLLETPTAEENLNPPPPILVVPKSEPLLLPSESLFRVKVQLPSRQALIDAGVRHMDLVLNYADQEETVLMIDVQDHMKSILDKELWREELRSRAATPSLSSLLMEPGPPPPEPEDPAPGGPSGVKVNASSGTLYPIYPITTTSTSSEGGSHPIKKVEVELEEDAVQTTTTRGEKAFKCGICGKRYRRKGWLDNHIRCHSRKPGGIRLPFPCPQCGRAFSQKANMTRHVKDLHGGRQGPDGEFKCFQCDTTNILI